MKKSILLITMGLVLASSGAWAQDDDVYFVPSSKAIAEETERYNSTPATFAPIGEDENFSESHWADNRGCGNRDVDDYNRRGKRYKGGDSEVVENKESYDEGYSDGYDDGYYTSRLVRFCSPRAGVYVSSPYYMDYFDLCYYDPWYYGYGSPWSWGWSGWYGWGTWYGWRPYYSSMYWGWGWNGWYDPWWGGSWHSHYNWYPSNAERGPLGGYIAYGGRRGSGPSTTTGGRTGFSNRPSLNYGYSGRGTSNRGTFGTQGNRPSRNFGNTDRPSRNYGTDRNNSARPNTSTSRPSRNFGSGERSNYNRSSNGGGFGGSRSGGYSGGSRGGGFGGGHSRGGRR